MSDRFRKTFAILLLCLAVQAHTASESTAKAAASFTFDSVWFYRDGTRVVPEIGRGWVSVGFDRRYLPAGDTGLSSDAEDSPIQQKARSMVKRHATLTEYLYDPNLAEDACFFRMRKGMSLEQIGRLIGQLKQEKGVRYVHPTLLLDNRTFAFFDSFELEWKTGTAQAQRDALLAASHVAPDEEAENRKGYRVHLAAIPFFRALNLLAEDIRVLKVTPRLVELKPSIGTKLSFLMGGGNIGDAIPFTLTIAFSDRVNIDPSSITTLNLRPPELQKELFDCTFDPYDYAKAVGKSPIVITGRVRFYAPGEFTIPPVQIGYTCPTCAKKRETAVSAGSANTSDGSSDNPDNSDGSGYFDPSSSDGTASLTTLPDPDSATGGSPDSTGSGSVADISDATNTVRLIETEPVLIKISSIIPADRSENRLIVPTDPAPVDYRLPGLHSTALRYLWLGVTSLAGLLLCAAYLLFLRHKGVRERERLREGKDHEELGCELRTLLETAPSAPHWSYLGEVGALLRDYLVALCGCDARYRGGSGRHFMHRIAPHLPGECATSLAGIFSAIDENVSVEARECPDIDKLQRRILEAVDRVAHLTATQR